MVRYDWLKQAIQEHQEGQLEIAEEAYLSWLQMYPEHVEVLDLLAILYAQTGRYHAAKDQLAHALNLEPENPRLMLHMAQVKRHLKEYDAAENLLTQALRIKPDYPEAALHLGRLMEALGDSTKARLVYQAAIAQHPKDYHLKHGLALNYLHDQQLLPAYDLWKEIVAGHPHHFESHFYLGTIAYEWNELLKAAAYFEAALALNANHAQVCSNLGAVYLKLGRQDDAIALFEQATHLEPGNLFAHTNLAASLLTLGRTEAAMNQYYELLAATPRDFTAHYNLATIFMEQRKWETARYHLQTAVELEPESFAAVSNLAHVLLKEQQQEAAIKCYRRAYQLKPDDQHTAYLLQALTGEGQPEAAPEQYVAELFDHYAYYFEQDVLDKLQYRVPELLHDLLKEILMGTSDLVIIDLGCGTGLCGPFLRLYASELIGIDVSKNMLTFAKEKQCYSKLIHADMVIGVKELTKKADLMIAADSLVYFGNLKGVLTAVKEQLNPSGKFVFSLEMHEAAADYQLQTSGRFAHRSDYVNQLLKAVGFTLLVKQAVILRSQAGSPVHGAIYALELKS